MKGNLYMSIPTKTRRLVSLLAVVVSVSTGASHAQITGTIWEGDSSGDATHIPTTGPSAQFNTAGINYDSRVTGYTIGTFLNNPTFFNQTGGFNSADAANNIHIEFTGSIFLNAGNNSFFVNHDDGLTLNITGIGLVVNQPGPTAPTTTPFNVNAPGAGNYSFVLEYNECCGSPSVLQWQINQQTVGGSVPEAASTWMLLSCSLLALYLVATRVRRAGMC